MKNKTKIIIILIVLVVIAVAGITTFYIISYKKQQKR